MKIEQTYRRQRDKVGQTGIYLDRRRNIQIDRQTKGEAHKETDRLRNRRKFVHTGREKDGQVDRESHRETKRRRDIQSTTQTERYKRR